MEWEGWIVAISACRFSPFGLCLVRFVSGSAESEWRDQSSLGWLVVVDWPGFWLVRSVGKTDMTTVKLAEFTWR